MVLSIVSAMGITVNAEGVCTSCVTFTADSEFNVSLIRGSFKATPTVSLEYSTDRVDWKNWDYSNIKTISAEKSGEKYTISIRSHNVNTRFAASAYSSSANCFSFTGKNGNPAPPIAASGNIMTLLD